MAGAAGAAEGVREAEPAVHLDGPEDGEGVVGVGGASVILGGHGLGHAADDPAEDGSDVVVFRRGETDEPVAVEDAVGDQGVEVDVEVHGAAEALDHRDATGPRFIHPSPPRGPSLLGEDGAGEDVEEAGGDLGPPGGLEPELPGQGEDPLPDGHLREHVLHEVQGDVLHPARGAGRADVYLAGEGHHPLEATIGAADTGKAPAVHSHHIKYRSHGGGDDETNQTGICLAHHLHGIHKGYVRVRGRAPDALVWELGEP